VMKMFENVSPFISIIEENNLTAVQNINSYFILHLIDHLKMDHNLNNLE
jgi:hypothetical protein